MTRGTRGWWEVRQGDCLELMRAMGDATIDAIVTDPPYGLGFMGKAWDCSVPGVDWAAECLRILKPGGHMIAFGGTRTVHRLTCAIEDAGFEIRDTIHWCYWSGFPKSLDVSKAIDAAAGAEREAIGPSPWNARKPNGSAGVSSVGLNATAGAPDITAPATEVAKQWDGWGTALKPAVEPAVLARKLLDGTVAANVLQWGTGGLNIDGCRFAYGDPAWVGPQEGWNDRPGMTAEHSFGRWPANLYYCPKASRAEREAGCEHLPARAGHEAVDREADTAGVNNPRAGAGRTADAIRNHHPTVKPVDLMAWLCRLVTPPGGVILDPFCGSGTTGIAAMREGFAFIGCEREPEYVAIARARIGEDMPLFSRGGV